MYIKLITEHSGYVLPESEPRDTTAHCHCRCMRYIFFTLPSCLRRTVPSFLWCAGLRKYSVCVSSFTKLYV